MNALVYELAIVAAQEKAKLDQCEALLASTTAMQVRTKTHAVLLGFSWGGGGGEGVVRYPLQRAKHFMCHISL
jgi:hypothetical protein